MKKLLIYGGKSLIEGTVSKKVLSLFIEIISKFLDKMFGTAASLGGGDCAVEGSKALILTFPLPVAYALGKSRHTAVGKSFHVFIGAQINKAFAL